MRTFLVCSLALATSQAFAAATFELSRAELQSMTQSAKGATLEIAALPVTSQSAAKVRLKRIEIYAPSTRIYRVDSAGKHEIARSDWAWFIADSNVPDAPLLSLGVAPDGSRAVGTLITADGTFDLQGEAKSGDLTIRLLEADRLAPEGKALTTSCGGALPGSGLDPLGVSFDAPTVSASKTSVSPNAASRQAVIAVDTDNELLSLKFAGNTTNATNYLAALFAAMNVIYERDVDLTLTQGTTFLRTAPDPFDNLDTMATIPQLTEFGNYWQANQAGTPRVLSMLVSGKSSSNFSSSGIAWLLSSGVYCNQRNGNGGAYSVSQVFKFAGSTASNDVQVIAHELGHNFGLNHTHCTSLTGTQPTGTNTIDQCFTGESSIGCFAGPQSCPANASGRTLMSYCHLTSPGLGGVACGGVTLAFHPTQITTLLARITTNLPSCITPVTSNENLFKNGFENP